MPNISDILNFQKTLPKKRMGAGALIRNEKGEILLLQPTYKENWEIPGGIVETDESPYQACLREIKEELGIKIKVERLLCVDYNPPVKDYLESLMFIFDGGILSESQIAMIRIDSEEHHRFIFVSLKESKKYLLKRLYQRLEVCYENLEANIIGSYLENQKRLPT